MVKDTTLDDLDVPVVIPTLDVTTLGGFEGKNTEQMLAAAQEADRVDHELTIRQALRKYKVAVFWAMLLSCALIMEGYDVVVIGSFYGQPQFIERFGSMGSNGKMAIQGEYSRVLVLQFLVYSGRQSLRKSTFCVPQRDGKRLCQTLPSAANSSVSPLTVFVKTVSVADPHIFVV